jgi:isopenicillin N synthase-like dioxygenase
MGSGALSPKSIPTIDLRPWFTGEPNAKANVARQVALACEDIGFFTVVGHGVAEDVIRRCYQAARAFFDQPIETKKSVAQRDGIPRGYVGFAESTVAYSMGQESPPDLREIYAIGPVDVDYADPYYSSQAAAGHFAPNVWPPAPPGFKEALTTYFQAGEQLAATIMRIFAVALDRPEEFFTPYIDRSISMIEILNYPALSSPPLPGQMRVGEHSDYGSLTILFHENKPGNLQVRTKDGEWVDAKATPGGFVINIGDLMAQWTNDRWVSTVHRVLPPPPEHMHDSRRIAIPFFHQPNYDAVITCIDDTAPPKYQPETSGDHLHRKLSAVTSQRTSAVDSL